MEQKNIISKYAQLIKVGCGIVHQLIWSKRPPMLKIGDQAPDFSVCDHNGNKINLKDFHGKKIVLWFYPKADTPGCTMEGQAFRDQFQRFLDKGVVVFGVSLDSQAENKAFAEKFSFPFPLLCDIKREISIAYKAIGGEDDKYAARISYVINKDGKIVEAIEKVDVKSHATDLCSRL